MTGHTFEVLLVEDNAGDARLMRELLRHGGGPGFAINHVPTLAEALGHLAFVAADVILLDLGLSDSQGLETFAAVRAQCPDAPVIIVSGLDDERAALAAVSQGAQDYVVKGRVDGSLLARIIRHSIERKRHESALVRSQDRFRALVEHGGDGILVVDDSGRVQYASPSTRTILGFSPEAVEGTDAMSIVEPSGAIAVADALAEARRRPGEPVRARATLRTSGGDVRVVEATVTNLLEDPSVRGFVVNYHDVTDRDRAESQARLLGVAVDQGPASVIITDADGHIQYVNRKFRELTGYTSEEAVGKTPRLVKSGVTPLALYERLWETIRLGGEFRAELQNRRKGGELYWNEIHISPVRNSRNDVTNYIGVQTDISARRQLDERLRASAHRVEELLDRYQRISEITFDGIAIIKDGRLVEVNNGLLDLLGLADDADALGSRLVDFIALGQREDVEGRLASGYEGAYETALIGQGGALVPVEVTARLHEMKGSMALVAAFRNLTERRSMEARLVQAQKMEAVGQLAAGVAHDFNNVLSVVLMCAEMSLASEGLTDELRKDFEAIHSSARRGADITRQLLTFSRKQVTQPRPLDINAILEELEPMLRQLTAGHMDVQVVPTATGTILGDPINVEQIAMNLVVNARDATSDGGSIAVKTHDATVAPGETPGLDPGKYVVLSVTDTGTGIDPAIQDKLFEPFFTTKPAGKGTGLGLSTVLTIVRALHGHIRVRSKFGHGTTFEIFLPRLGTAVATDSASVAAPPSLRGVETILVVDDETSVRESISRVLRGHGYEIIEAKNGRDALLALEQAAQSPALVVTDLVMPEVNGSELLEAIRSSVPEVPALVISGYSGSALDPDMLGPRTAFLAKPFRARALATRVRELLDAGTSAPAA